MKLALCALYENDISLQCKKMTGGKCMTIFTRLLANWREAWRLLLLDGLMFSVFGLMVFHRNHSSWLMGFMLIGATTVILRNDMRAVLRRFITFERTQDIDLRWISWPFLGWFFVALLIWASAAQADAGNFPDRALIFPVALSLLALTFGYRPSSRWFVAGVLAAACMTAGVATWDVFVAQNSRAGADSLRESQALSFGNWSMMAAMLLVLTSALARHLLLGWRVGLLVLALLPLWASIASGTRGSFLALPVSGFLLLLLPKDRFHRWLLLLGMMGTVLLGVFLFNSDAVQQQLRLDAAKQDLAQAGEQRFATSIGARIVMWEAAWKMFKLQPLTGVGPKGYRPRLRDMMEKGEIPRLQEAFGHAHSDSMHMLATGGVIGLLAYLAILMGPLIFFSRALCINRENVRKRLYAASGILTVGAFFCFGLTMVNVTRWFPSLMYALLVCVFAAQLLPESKSTKAS